ncbi:MAG: DUF4412 domain-containing protein [Flavobacteriaceae bacterium]|nr:DUF4412 domain-containing protein [Flavobacteriaceae bacterium]
MKNILLSVIFLLGLLGNVQPVEAQLWKKLKKRAKEAAERTLERKVEDKTVQKTEKAMDTILNVDKKIKGKKKTNEMPSQTYDFTYKYVMQMIDGKKIVDFEYLLIEGGDYLGINMSASKNDMVTVIDIQKQTMFMFMKNGDQKTQMSIGFNFEDVESEVDEAYDVEINQTNNTKIILGYNCTEYNVKGNGFEGSVWITQEANITFPKSFYKMKNKRFKTTKSMDQSWIANIDGLTLEMNIIDTTKKKPKTIQMNCIALEKQDYSIETSMYKKMN